uniref:Kazal-like domain-containing protein n=1 Tax=Balaenoptera musculus TaxID=9771 RepID=A0A8C0C3N4_BALMU
NILKSRLSWFNGTVNPCPGIYQPICGNNLVTYENPCILCVESILEPSTQRSFCNFHKEQ